MHWRLGQLQPATASRARRLRIDGNNLITVTDNGGEDRHGKFRRPHENDTH